MENITGYPVTDKNYLSTRLYLVDEVRSLVRERSIIIEAPRRYGKTSVIKELIRQENDNKERDREFNVLFLDLEGEETINDFCFKLFHELLKLYRFREKLDTVLTFLGDRWNDLASRFRKVDAMEIGIEIREKTRDYDFPAWKEKIRPLLIGLNSSKKRTVIIFDEFPDMLLNFKNNAAELSEYKRDTDRLMAWLRSLRQEQDHGSKYQFVFCGSINLRKTLEEIGIGKRINDLEAFVIPPMKRDETKVLIESLARKSSIEIERGGVRFMELKIENGSPYYGQIFFKALRDSRGNSYSSDQVRTIYESMLRGGNHDLNHFHSRLNEYLTPLERECSTLILKHLCHGEMDEKDLYDGFLFEKCDNDMFQALVDRLIHEGYLTRNMEKKGKLGFVSPILMDWWACKAPGRK